MAGVMRAEVVRGAINTESSPQGLCFLDGERHGIIHLRAPRKQDYLQFALHLAVFRITVIS